jgi:hypothetical protein
VLKLGSNKKSETFILYRFEFYAKAYFVIDDIEVFKSPKKIGNEITIIIVIHFEWVKSFVRQRKSAYNGFGLIISPDIFGV